MARWRLWVAVAIVGLAGWIGWGCKEKSSLSGVPEQGKVPATTRASTAELPLEVMMERWGGDGLSAEEKRATCKRLLGLAEDTTQWNPGWDRFLAERHARKDLEEDLWEAYWRTQWRFGLVARAGMGPGDPVAVGVFPVRRKLRAFDGVGNSWVMDVNATWQVKRLAVDGMGWDVEGTVGSAGSMNGTVVGSFCGVDLEAKGRGRLTAGKHRFRAEVELKIDSTGFQDEAGKWSDAVIRVRVPVEGGFAIEEKSTAVKRLHLRERPGGNPVAAPIVQAVRAAEGGWTVRVVFAGGPEVPVSADVVVRIGRTAYSAGSVLLSRGKAGVTRVVFHVDELEDDLAHVTLYPNERPIRMTHLTEMWGDSIGFEQVPVGTWRD